MAAANFCPNCGVPHDEGAHFCPECGHPFAAAGTPPPAAAPPPPAPAPMGAGPMPIAPAPAPADGGGSRRGLWIALGAIVAVLALVSVALVLVISRDDGDDEAEVFLESVGERGDDPFTTSIDIHNESSADADATVATTAPAIPLPAAASQTVPVATRGVVGAWPGLYGGTRDRSTCDPEQLVAFLQQNPDKARAWAGVLGIDVADIEAYVDSLTPIILQRDTRVTNHGFRDGRATTLQSVLQAGTAVMVDEFGVPRVKCNCGNPLTEPEALPRRPRYTGTRWPTFAPVNVIRVTADVTVNVFVLVDVDGGEPINRPVGTTGDQDEETTIEDVCDLYPDDPSCEGVAAPDDPGGTTGTDDPGGPTLGTGDMQFTLRWGSTADLDLAVSGPDGSEVNFDSPRSPSGGTLDVDSNQDCATASAPAVENVYWPEGQAPEGTYTVTVSYFAECGSGSGPQSYELSFLSDGVEGELTPASIRPGSDGSIVASYELELIPGTLGRMGRLQKVSGTLQPGGSKSYKAQKAPATTTTTQAPTTAAPTTAADTTPGAEEDPVPEPPDCSQYPPGSMMEILCEHDPFSA